MTELMRRRRALMAAKDDEPLALVGGSYDSGKIVVSNGNHLSINSPTQGRTNRIPLNKKVKINSGDIIQLKAGGINVTPKARRYGVVINGQDYAIRENKPGTSTWYNVDGAGAGNGTMTDVTITTSETGWVAEIDLSIMINGEVIL